MAKEVKIEDLKKIMDQNLKLTEENQEMIKKIRRYLLISRIWGLIKVLIILAPIILGIIYLPSLINNAFEDMKEGLGLNKVEQTINTIVPVTEKILSK